MRLFSLSLLLHYLSFLVAVSAAARLLLNSLLSVLKSFTKKISFFAFLDFSSILDSFVYLYLGIYISICLVLSFSRVWLSRVVGLALTKKCLPFLGVDASRRGVA